MTVAVIPSACVGLTRYFYPKSERSDAVLFEQVEHALATVDRVVTAPLTSYQREALACLVSDMEAGLCERPSPDLFERSMLATYLNARMYQLAAGEFSAFIFVNGEFNERAHNKRRAEFYLFSLGRLLFE